MSFIETPRFPVDISYGAVGGPGFSTSIAATQGGFESRNQNWAQSRCKYDVAHGLRNQTDMDTLIAFFRSVKGRAHGFRFKDWSDYTVTAANGKVGTGVGAGVPAYQLHKLYTSGALTDYRDIRKPVSGSVTAYRNGAAITVGSAAGNIAIDSTTGTVTFVADASSGASAITVGATTQVILSANPGSLVAGNLLYLNGFTGTDAALVNGIAHTINSVTGTGPYTFTLATVTTGKTITFTGGVGYKYPQASDTLTWVGEFDVPCRFDTDDMKVSIDSYNVYNWNQIPVWEIRT
jgi:uncharacterized protein (TIGR02217 family)